MFIFILVLILEITFNYYFRNVVRFVIDNFEFKKSLGQNFLIDGNVINKIVENSLVDKDTLVIEIGPGGGAISKLLIPKSGYSILYEIDERLKDCLKEQLPYDNYKLVFQDFLEADVFADIGYLDYSKLYVVANLPYYITTPIITKFIEDNIFPDKIVIMVQKEVADRLCAKVSTRDYGSLTVFLDYYYDVKKMCDVSKKCFVPVPGVDSSVVVMDLKKDRKKVKDIALFNKLVKDSFRFKRKTIKNNLREYDLEVVESVLKKYGLDSSCRSENVCLEAFIDIAEELVNSEFKLRNDK